MRHAPVDAVAASSGAPKGSIYHRFGSIDELLATMWIRAVLRAQAEFLTAVDHDDPLEAAVAAALSSHDFCRRHPADARLLVSLRREDLLRQQPSPSLRRDLRDLNRPVGAALATLARRLYGSASQPAIQRTALGVVDIPAGAMRRHLLAGQPLPPALPGQLEAAVRAVLA